VDGEDGGPMVDLSSIQYPFNHNPRRLKMAQIHNEHVWAYAEQLPEVISWDEEGTDREYPRGECIQELAQEEMYLVQDDEEDDEDEDYQGVLYLRPLNEEIPF
jgi:hypothetical protein